METRRVTYSYARGETRVFSDSVTFDEFEFTDEQLGERRQFLKERVEKRQSHFKSMLAVPRSTFFSMSDGKLKRMSVTRRSLSVSMLRSDDSPGNDRSFEAGSPSAVSCLAEA